MSQPRPPFNPERRTLHHDYLVCEASGIIIHWFEHFLDAHDYRHTLHREVFLWCCLSDQPPFLTDQDEHEEVTDAYEQRD
jgi:hypothetical protein